MRPLPQLTGALPRGVTPPEEMANPAPSASVQRMEVVVDTQVNGPRVIAIRYASVGVFTPALERHCVPVHTATLPSGVRVADRGGERVRHMVWLMELDPKLKSISQLMFPEGERNSVPVGVCGTNVPVVCPAVEVVPRAVVEVVATDVLVDVAVVGGAALLEQAAAKVALPIIPTRGPVGQCRRPRTDAAYEGGARRASIRGRSPTLAYGAGRACPAYGRDRTGVHMNQLPTAVPNLAAGVAGGLIIGGAIFLALFSVVLLVPIILIVANRAEPDQRGLRPLSVYLFGMSFVTLQLTFAGSVLIVTSLFSVIAPHDSPLTNTVARQVVIGALIVVLAGATLLLHLGRGVETARGDGPVTGPNLRVMHSYAAVVGFVYFLQLVFALGTAVYLVFALVAPGVFGSIGSSRSGTLALLLDLAYVMLVSGYIVVAHSAIGPSALRPGRAPALPAEPEPAT